MTAYKPRKPGSFEEAVTKMRDLLGADEMGVRVGVSTTAINHACDADQPTYTPLAVHRCLTLDVWYTRLTGRPGPILSAYQRQFAEQTRQMPVAGAPHENIANLSKEANDVVQAIARAMSEESEAGAAPSRNESVEIIREVDDAIRILEAIRTKHARNAGLLPEAAQEPGEAA